MLQHLADQPEMFIIGIQHTEYVQLLGIQNGYSSLCSIARKDYDIFARIVELAVMQIAQSLICRVLLGAHHTTSIAKKT